MRTIRLVTLVLVLLLTGSTLGHAAEIIDRIVVTVNGDAILQSDVDTELHYEALAEGKAIDSLNTGEWQASLDRLIDQHLLRREMTSDFPTPPESEVEKRIASLRKQIADGTDSQDGWLSLLRRYDLSPDDVAEKVRAQMQLTGFIDQRLRPGIRIPYKEVQGYYQDELIPELKKAGVQQEPPLHQVRTQIEEVLIQQQISSQLNDWVRNLRQQAHIRITPDPIRPSPGVAGGGWRVQSIPGGGTRPANDSRNK